MLSLCAPSSNSSAICFGIGFGFGGHKLDIQIIPF